MKNKLWIFLIIIFIIAISIGIYLFNRNKNTQNNYTTDRTSLNTQNNSENTETYNNINEENRINITINSTGTNQKQEAILSSFSTKIYTKDPARQNNISRTCNTLSGTIIPNGSEFSFCNTVGKATSDKGYQEADIFDKDGHKEKGLGGGNCQVSTTLYNAVLSIPSLVVTERHEHSNAVPYIEDGKDAAVAYGSYDLKFINNTGYDVKIKAENTEDAVNITLYKIF